MSTETVADRLWTTKFPMPNGPIQMIGYPADDDAALHLAFVHFGSINHCALMRLWLFPGLEHWCSGHSATSEILSREFQRFLNTYNGMAIALHQNPGMIGQMVFGMDLNLPLTWCTPCQEDDFTISEFCKVKRILRDCKVSEVSLEYPVMPNSGCTLLKEFGPRALRER